MRVLVRADASQDIGTGHVMRCAALGLRLQERGGDIHFLCSALPAGLVDWLAARGMQVHMLPATSLQDAAADLVASSMIARQFGRCDLLVVDHYGLAKDWESGMRVHTRRLMVIDDLADRDHDCDVLLDQNLHRDAEHRYAGRIAASAQAFVGPRFALLRQDFDDESLLRQRDGHLKQLLVFFGGTDPGNQCLKIIDALRLLGDRAPQTTIVLGPAHASREAVHACAAGMAFLKVLDATDNMAVLMSQADLAIGTCGIAAWERCVIGLPSLVVVTAENQREDAEILHELGAVEYLGDAEDVGAARWASALAALLDSPSRLQAMGHASLAVVAGRAGAFAELLGALSVGHV